MKWTSSPRLPAVVGLAFADGVLRLAHAARTKAGAETLRTAAAPLTIDLLQAEPELAGQELRNHFEAAGIREKRCVVALPSAWIVSQHCAVPELSPEDTASLLRLEAEKAFPSDPDELQIALSPQQGTASRYVTQLAVRQDQIARLGAVLKAAGLRPVSYTVGPAALPGAVPPAGDGAMLLLLEPKGATLLVSAGGGLAAFRTLEATIDSEAGENVINARALARELRVSFEQIPADLRAGVKRLVLRGEDAMVRSLAESLAGWAADAGLRLEPDLLPVRPVAEEIVVQLAERQLRDGPPALEFLPPRPSRFALLLARYNSRRLATAGFAAAAAAVLTLGAFGWQEYRRWSLRTEWEAMAAQVAELEGVQARIREFRPWYDTGFRDLTIIKRIVECFPDSGSVSAKSLEIHGSVVTITGTARDNASLLRTLDQIRLLKEVQGLKIEQIRGKTPAQFTFTFRWTGTTGT